MNIANKTASIIPLALFTTLIITRKLKQLIHQPNNALNKTQLETSIEHLHIYLRCLIIIFLFAIFKLLDLCF